MTLTVTGTADLAITLGVPTGVRAGRTFTATLSVRNAGPETSAQVATGVTR